MENRIQHNGRQPRPEVSQQETLNRILRYLAHIASDVTSGKLDPAAVNWRYIRSQISDVQHH